MRLQLRTFGDTIKGIVDAATVRSRVETSVNKRNKTGSLAEDHHLPH
jgi:hypothetical protein